MTAESRASQNLPQRVIRLVQSAAAAGESDPDSAYAISFAWNDGHGSGIYSWDYLRRHCQCEVCRAHLNPRLVETRLRPKSRGVPLTEER